MSHPLSGLRVRTITIGSNNIYPRACLGRTPHLSIKPCLDMTSFGKRLLLFIAMTHACCGLRLCTVSKNSNDIYLRACLGRTPLPLEHVRARTLFSPPSKNTLQDLTLRRGKLTSEAFLQYSTSSTTLPETPTNVGRDLTCEKLTSTSVSIVKCMGSHIVFNFLKSSQCLRVTLLMTKLLSSSSSTKMCLDSTFYHVSLLSSKNSGDIPPLSGMPGHVPPSPRENTQQNFRLKSW